jgi:prepilin-type N-terminal cleavage/methylation domain-containing protein
MRPASFNNQNPKAGFTLLELIVAMAVFSLIGGVLVTIFVTSVQYFSNEKSQIFNQYRITYLSDAFEVDTRRSTEVNIVSGCLVFTISSGNSTYCLNTSTHIVTRNNVQIADNIQTLSTTLNVNKLDLTVVTVADQRGITNTIHLTYYIREGNY